MVAATHVVAVDVSGDDSEDDDDDDDESARAVMLEWPAAMRAARHSGAQQRRHGAIMFAAL